MGASGEASLVGAREKEEGVGRGGGGEGATGLATTHNMAAGMFRYI